MLRRGRRLLPSARLLERQADRSGFASLSEPVAPQAAGPELVRLSAGAPLLVGLRERVWGASSVLPPSALPAGEQPERVAVVRDAFTRSHDPPSALADAVAPLAGGGVAVAADFSQHHRRLVADEYQRAPDGSYALTAVATDLFRLLKREGLRVAHVPDVRCPPPNAATAAASGGSRQSTNEVLMVAPTAFGFNAEAAQDNAFMHSAAAPEQGSEGANITRRVLREYAGLHRELSEVAGVRVNLFAHSLEHATPDACFPNNWFSTHPAGEAGGGTQQSTLVFYPMKCPNRARERRLDVQSVLRGRGYARVLDLSAAEADGAHFEGTGALVLDRINGVAYVALSERADRQLAEHWVQQLGYRELVAFSSCDPGGKPVYHTNVVMAVGTDVAVVCLESVADPRERAHLRSRLAAHHTVVDISQAQMAALCGNVLELQDGRGLPVLAMSSRAYNAFTPEQRRLLRRHVAELHHAPIDTLEHIGGGGVRCALGEVFV